MRESVHTKVTLRGADITVFYYVFFNCFNSAGLI